MANGDNGLYVQYITAWRTAGDDGEDLEDDEKVDPTPGGGGDEGFKFSHMTFTNIYKKTNGGGTTDPTKTVLDITKTVTGTSANETSYFKFDVTVNDPKVGDPADSYIAYVYDKDGIVSDLKNNYTDLTTVEIDTDDKSNQYFVFTPGDEMTILLKHGQKLGFVDLPVGASFKVTEQGAAEYTASYDLILNGGTAINVVADNIGDALSAPKTGTALIGEKKNSVAFVNERDFKVPTGISVNNLPYIVMIAMAIAALALYMTVRFRRLNMDYTA